MTDEPTDPPSPPGGHAWGLVDRLRAADPRVPVVERGLLAARLGATVQDLDLLDAGTVADLLAQPAAVLHAFGAARLLEHLDAVVARAHPVALDRPTTDVVVATVLVDDGDVTLTAALQLDLVDPLVVLEVDDREAVQVDLDETEALAYALLRLIDVARARPTTDPTEEDDRE